MDEYLLGALIACIIVIILFLIGFIVLLSSSVAPLWAEVLTGITGTIIVIVILGVLKTFIKL